MLQSVLSWIEFQFSLSSFFVLFHQGVNLLLSKRFTVETFVHFHDFLTFGLHFLFLGLLCESSSSLLLWHWLDIVKWCLKIDVDVSLYNTDLIIWLAINDINGIIFSIIVDINSVSLKDTRVLCKFSL